MPEPPPVAMDAPDDARPVSMIVREHTKTLAAAGVPTPAVDARTLTRHALGFDVSDLATRTIGGVEPADLERLDDLVAQRARRVPLQHLTGEAGFLDITVACRPGVFVPRPETETLAAEALSRLRDVVADKGEAFVVEPCTGTGAVALAIAASVPGSRVIASDVSSAAVALATENRDHLVRAGRLDHPLRCRIAKGDLFDPLPDELEGHIDMLVSNPPYLTRAEVDAAEPEVRDHDPVDALVAADGGFAIIDRLLDEGWTWLVPGGWLLLEVAEMRAHDTAERARRAGYTVVDVVSDLAGRARVLVARRTNEENGA